MVFYVLAFSVPDESRDRNSPGGLSKNRYGEYDRCKDHGRSLRLENGWIVINHLSFEREKSNISHHLEE